MHKNADRKQRRFGLWLLVTAALLPVGLSFYGIDPLIIFLVSFLCVPSILLASGLWVQTGARRRVIQQKSAIVIAALAAVVSVLTTHWPLRLAFRLSEAALDHLARQQEALNNQSCSYGTTLEELFAQNARIIRDERSGIFFIRRAGINNDGDVCLWLGRTESGSHIGFIHAVSSQAPLTGPLHRNLDNNIVLGDNWHFVVED